MKSIAQQIRENALATAINEARMIEYRAQLGDVQDSEGLPITVSILVEKEHQKAFEKWLEDEEGNIFNHAEGGNVEY